MAYSCVPNRDIAEISPRYRRGIAEMWPRYGQDGTRACLAASRGISRRYLGDLPAAEPRRGMRKSIGMRSPASRSHTPDGDGVAVGSPAVATETWSERIMPAR